MKGQRGYLAVVVAVSWLVFAQASSEPSVAEGEVLDSEGRAVVAATVYALAEDNMLTRASITDTNDAGEFAIRIGRPGTFYLHAYKEGDGYPDSQFAFFRTSDLEWVKITIHAKEISGA